MDARTRQFIGLVREAIIAECAEEWSKRINQAMAEFSAKGRLHSGATIHFAVQIMEEISVKSIEQLDSKIRPVCPDEYGFHQIETGMASIIAHMEMRLDEVLKTIGRGTISQSIRAASKDLFDKMASRIKRKVALLEFEYQATETQAAKDNGIATPPQLAPAPMSKVGRPASEFWDEMWAEICCQLFNGDLQPKRQVDIEEAMTQLIENAGETAAVSTVRKRARILWDKLSSNN
jgi:hypothetical protein